MSPRFLLVVIKLPNCVPLKVYRLRLFFLLLVLFFLKFFSYYVASQGVIYCSCTLYGAIAPSSIVCLDHSLCAVRTLYRANHLMRTIYLLAGFDQITASCINGSCKPNYRTMDV
ncbi:hypothetical protein F5Y05DRAFT_312538 [Hypoxylon sp. FL0543]|nr:hypothetical protein F5Y05DRAFT_312538 [Hypoxylon sp. FL0543]